MSNIRINPIFTNLFGDFMNTSFGDIVDNFETRLFPRINIEENDTSFVLDVEVPGFSKEEVSVRLEKDRLIISSVHIEESEKNEENFSRKEFKKKQFKRSYQLPESIDHKGIVAQHENGILEITLPKSKEEINKVRSIEIS